MRRLKHASVSQLEVRRREIADAIAEVAELEFWNAGGSGSVDSTTLRPGGHRDRRRVRAAGARPVRPLPSRSSRSPAAFFALPVVRRPSDQMVTVHGGGLVASGPAGKDRLPIPWAPSGLHLTGLEGAGEVQTPLDRARGAAAEGRRPGVVPARQGRRAVRAHQHRPAAGGRGVRRRGADVPRVRARVLMSGVVPGRRSPRSSTTRWRSRRGWATGGWSASTAPPARASRPWRRAVAEAGQARVASVHVIHTDDLLDGWRGLPGLGRSCSMTTWSSRWRPARPARYRRYDWVAGAFAEEHVVAPMDLLVLEGVGTGHPLLAPLRRAHAGLGRGRRRAPAGPRAGARRRGDAARVGAVHARRGGVLRASTPCASTRT